MRRKFPSTKDVLTLCKLPDRGHQTGAWMALLWAAVLLGATPAMVRADQVEMQNGDRYVGKVLSLDAATLVLQSEVLGAVRLPREQVSLITLGRSRELNVGGSPSGTNAVDRAMRRPSAALTGARTNGEADLSAALRQLGANTNFIQQVQSQFLADAGPEANKKFNELVGGLMSGKVTMKDLRAEAKSAADQLRALKRDLGDEAGWAVDSYLTILDNFLRETAPASASATNAVGH